MSGIKTDVALIGAGIMSATLGALIKTVRPDASIAMFEVLDAVSAESSDPWNNAGTGHSALCELNYTPQTADGDVDITKAITINEQFQVSRQFWSHAIERGILTSPKSFINPIPHVSFVHGADNVEYLRKRYDNLSAHPLFAGMEFITDEQTFTDRLPLMAAGRDFSDPIALNWSDRGTDVDFGALTLQLVNHIADGGEVYFGHKVTSLKKQSDGRWLITAKNLRTGEKVTVDAGFVFVGAGGGALELLQKSGIKEIKGFGGFPVSGAFFRSTNTELNEQHHAKVYGKAAVGAPPMSVPHLDTRVIGGQQGLLFGPYAGWSPKFLKAGGNLDLLKTVKPGNVVPMMSIAPKEVGLIKYLLKELTTSKAGRVETLSEFVPRADGDDWELIIAGQRVQVIKKSGAGGELQFGTEVITAEDGTIAGLLGASPGASTAVPAMLTVLQRCFKSDWSTWHHTLSEAIPSLGTELSNQPQLFQQVWDWTTKTLQLDQDHAPGDLHAVPAQVGQPAVTTTTADETATA